MTHYRKLIWGALAFCLLSSTLVQAQPDRWQQRAEYDITIDLNDQDHSFKGTQQLKYANNSPDALDRIFYHLYFNAFQPGSMMDVRSSTIKDADPRVGKRIGKLTDKEMGKMRIETLQLLSLIHI